MPTGRNIGGAYTRRPGVYSVIDASSLDTVGPGARGVVAILGEWSRGGEPKKVQVVTSASQLRRLMPNNDGAILSKLLFSPSADDRIKGGASKALLVRVNGSERASATLKDADGGDSLKVLAADWGAYGNAITVKLEEDASAGIKTLTVKVGEDTEAISIAKEGTTYVPALKVTNNGDAAMDVSVDANGLHVGTTVFGPETKLTDLSMDGVAFEVQTPKEMTVADLDALDSTSLAAGASSTLTAEAAKWEEMGSTLGLVVIERASTPAKAPAATDETNLSGGTNATAALPDWQDGLDLLKTEFVNIVVPLCTSETLDTVKAVADKLKEHCEYMAGQGKDERNGYVGMTSGPSFNDVIGAARYLNTRHVSLLAQQIQLYDENGNPVWLHPAYTGLLAAGMQAGRPVGVPLTWKYVDVLAVDDGSDWTANDRVEDMIASGVMLLTRDHLGWKWERSVTTYVRTDNPIFSEVSANESANESVKDLRRYLELLIGDPMFAGTAQTVKGLAMQRLDQQVRENLIKAWQNLEIEDVGDGLNIGYEVAVVEPLNFIVMTAHVVRIPGVAK